MLPPPAALVAALALVAAAHRPPAPVRPARPTGAARAAGAPDAPVREAYRLEDAALRAGLEERQRLRLPLEPPNRGRLCSRGLAALLERDARYSQDTGQVGNLDFDPFVSGQDVEPGAFADLAIDVPRATASRAEVRARFTSFGPREVRFLVVLEDGRWVIDDVRDERTTLRAELSRPYFCADGWDEACVEAPREEELPDSLEPATATSASAPRAR